VETPASPTRPRRLLAAATALALIPIGVAWRMAPLHLPQFLYKYGGSVLWAAMVYWIVAAIFPRLAPAAVAAASAVIAALVEFFRLFHTPGMDAFRITLAGKLILGRFFSLRNIVAYWLAIGVSALIDRALQRRFRGFSATLAGRP
jgi:hypothetical protein